MAIELQKTRTKKQQQSLASQYSRNNESEKIYQLYTREFSSLNADAIKFYFDAAQKGINFFKAFLFEEIRRRDLRIGGLCQTRKLSVLGEQWNVDGDNVQLKDFVLENFRRINLNQFIADCVEAQLQGMSVFQLFYDISGSRQYLSDVALIPNYLIYTKNGIQFIDFSKTTVYQLRASVAVDTPNLPLIDLDPMYYLETYSFDGNEENGLMNGLIDSIIWGYFFKSYGLKDWSVFLERFAMPSVIGKYDPLMSAQDRATLKQAVDEFGNLFRATIPNTASIDVTGDAGKQSAGALYENYLKFWNDELSIRILGQAMTTDTGQGGSYAKAQVGNLVREDLKAGDKALIVSTVNLLIKKIVDLNFSSVSEYPVFSFVEDEKIDYMLKKADLLVKLKQAGFDADEKELTEIFGMTLTKSVNSNQSLVISNAEFSENKKNKKQLIEDYLLELWSTLQ